MSISSMSINELKDECKRLIEKEEYESSKRYYTKFIELIIFRMITEEKFFAHIVMQLKRRIDFKLPAPAAVNQTISGYSLYTNPLFLLNYTINEITSILIHECYHILNYHIPRAEKYKGNTSNSIVNISMDCSINQYIDGLPEGHITVASIVKMLDGKVSVERKREYEYYVKLFNDNKEKLKGGDNGNDMLDKVQGDNSGEINNSDMGNNKGKGLQNHDKWKESDGMLDEKNGKQISKNIANKAMEQLSAKERGKVSSHIQEMINNLNTKAIIPWQQELKKFVGSVKVPYKRTMQRRSRRQPKRFDVRGKISDRTLRMGVAIDTSGSMGKDELEFSFNEIFHILKQTKFNLTVIECDSKVQRTYTAKSKKDIDLNVMGRGGTSFSPIIDHVNDKIKNLDLLVIFTDGYGEYSLKNRPIGRYKIIWVLTGRRSELSLVEPHGIVKELNMHDK